MYVIATSKNLAYFDIRCNSLANVYLSLTLSSTVPQEKTLLLAVQNGSIETVASILSEICTQISSSSPSTTSAPANDRGDRVAAKPVTETGKTGSGPETMDTSESPSSKTSLDGGKGGAGGTKGAEIERESKTEPNLRRKRKNEPSTEPHVRKRRKSKDEKETGKQEDSSTSAVTAEIGGKLVTTEIGGKTLPMKGAGFDNAAVLLETGVDNCNILHVCCGGGGGGGVGEELTGRRLDILDRILSCKPVRPVITRLVRC